ncbi:Protein sax-3 [Sarcoptes scabiei]|uniref:Protein sax-3 n=1 Tax=Sarcoptes scabiei TaxID=52283 RepID=A0A834R5R0_SARSC|nr:Protein sax-3 [Sarcoptes scabiei]
MPVNTKVALGKTITMECSPPKGRPEPIVTWTHNSKPIAADSSRFKIDGGNLIIQDVMQHDEGQYQCIAKNMIGVRESPAAMLKVLIEPYFIRPPESVKTMSNSDVVFHCQVGGDPQPKISWRKVEGEIAIGKSQLLEDKALRIYQVKPSDEGTYVCDAENSAGKISKSVTLIVNSLPNFIISPKNVQILDGETARMECKAIGNPEPICFWFKESAHILMFPGQSYGKMNVSENGLLSIANVGKEDEGNYICAAISNVGSIITRAFLKVSSKEDLPPPLIRLGATNQTLPLNTKAFLPCEASTADLKRKIVVEWLYNHIPIYNDSHFLITPNGLLIQNIQRTDSGVYTCQASIPTGSTRWNARLLVESPRNPNINFSKMPHFTMFPDAPSKPVIVNVTDTTVTLKWKRSGNNPISPHLGSMIEYYSPELRNEWTEIARNIRSDYYTVENLQPNHRYFFYVRSQNIHGFGLASEVSDEVRTSNQLETSNELSNRQIENAHLERARELLDNINVKLRDARASSSTSIKLLWNVIGNPDLIEGYYIRYQNLKNDPDQIKFNMVTVFGGSAMSYVVNDLQKFSTYQFFIMPFYRNIEGRPSNIVSERTYEDVPSGPPYSITAKVINASCAVIEWLPPLDPYQNGIILGYYLQIYENKTYLFTNLTLDASFNSIVLYNLTLGSMFSVQISAYTAIGNGPLSVPIYLTMDTYQERRDFDLDPINQYSIFSSIFWFYLFILLMALIFVLISIRLFLIFNNRKHQNKSIYEKAHNPNENFNENFLKYDSGSSKYSSCPDNNEYAELDDCKDFIRDHPNKAVYAEAPLIMKSKDLDTERVNSDGQRFYQHSSDDSSNEALLINNHNHHSNTITNHSKCEMINLKNHLPVVNGRSSKRYNQLGFQRNEIKSNDQTPTSKHRQFSDVNSSSTLDEDDNCHKQQPSYDSTKHNFALSGRPAYVIVDETVSQKIPTSFNRQFGHNLMTFGHNSDASLTRITTNPLSSFDSSSESSVTMNNQQSFVSQHYASSEIAKMPMFNDHSSLSSSSPLSKTSKNRFFDSIESYHETNSQLSESNSNTDTVGSTFDCSAPRLPKGIHDHMVKNRFHMNRKRSTNHQNKFHKPFD